MNQFTAVVVSHGYGFDAHEPLGEIACRHRLCGLAQLVIDQPQALTGSEPNIAYPRPLGTDVLRLDGGIEQPQGGIEMRQVSSLLHKLLLKLTQRSRQFCPLVPQCTDDMQLAHRRLLQR